VFLTAVTAIFFAPIAYMLIGSFKPTAEVLDGINGFVPKNLSFNNYLQVFATFNDESIGFLWRFYANSILVSFVIVFGGLIVNSMIAYALARLRWRGRDAIQVMVILLVILPFEAIAIPLFFLLRDYRNTYFVQFLPFIASAFSIYLFYTFFIGLPLEIQESARLDGASPWRIFRAIIIPMSKPVFASVTILSFLGAWSSFLFPLMMVDNPLYVPLPLEIQVYFSQPPTDWGPIFAFGVILVLPVLAVFLLFQRWFIQSVAASAIKG
jgi:multiple sugar transport system permease protein